MSFGAGTQSTALALMVLQKHELLTERAGVGVSTPWPELFLFADTGDEPRAVYRHLWKLASMFAEADHAQLRIVRRGQKSLSEHVLYKAESGEGGMATPPFFVGEKGNGIPIGRSCTTEFKARPLDRAAKQYGRDKYGQSSFWAHQWFGISNDEKHRMREPDRHDRKWRQYVYPLVRMGWTRWHCIQFLKEQTYSDGTPVEIVRSACVFCPFHDQEEWRHIADHPEDWERAKKFESQVHEIYEREDGFAGIRKKPHLTRTVEPLDEYDLEVDDRQVDLWKEYTTGMHQCAGHCGV